MAVERNYKCDLCGNRVRLDPSAEGDRAIGIYWNTWPKGWLIKPAREVERHLCPICISSIQAMPRICSQGYECNGGPKCPGDHK